jgi:hypothetical protein
MSTKTDISVNMKEYKKAINNYRCTLMACSECGDRSECYIQPAIDRVKKCYNSLTEIEKKQVSLPQICKNNSNNNGFNEGLSIGLSELH